MARVRLRFPFQRLALVAGITATLIAAALVPTADASYGWSRGVDSWVTNLQTDQRLTRQSPIAWQRGAGAAGNTIVVDPTKRYQTMTGFGASMTDSSAYVLSKLPPQTRRQIMTELFSPADGIGISMLRQPMGASDFAVEKAYSYDDQPVGQTDPDLSDFSIAHDRAYILPRLREAYALNPKLTFMASPWSAPGWMKDGDSMIQGSLLPKYHQAYANYFAEFIKAYRRAGIPTDYVSMQNEPLYEPDSYPGMGVMPDQAATFIGRYLGPTLKREGLRDTEILGYDHNWDVTDYPEAIYADRKANRYTDGTAWHCYGGEVVAQSISHNNYPHAQAFQTECSGGQWQANADGEFDEQVAFDQTMSSIIGGPRNWSQSIVFWNLALDQKNGPFIGGCDVCRGVVTVNTDTLTVRKEMEFWALAHATKFLRPGSVRIGSSVHPTAADPDAENRGLTNVAFRAKDGAQVLIAHNATDAAQTFAVQVGGRHFSATLAAGAAATYRWQAPDRLRPADLGWVDLDFGRGPKGTPTGRLVASVGPEVVGAMNQVNLGDTSNPRWVGYTQPYGAELRAGAAQTLSRAGWTVATAGMGPEEEPTANMLDGDPATRWASGGGQAPGMSVTLDLGGRRTFSEIALDTAASPGDYLRQYAVEVSANGSDWAEIARGTGKPTTAGTMSILLPQTIASHVRLSSRTTSGSWWSIHEVNLRLAAGAAATTPGRGLVRDRGTLADGTAIVGWYNAGNRPAVVPWPGRSTDHTMGYTYWLPPRAAVTFAVGGAAPAERIAPRTTVTPGG